MPGGSAANTGTVGYAQLVNSETINDGTVGGVFFPAVASTDVPSTGNTPIVEIPVVNGTATGNFTVYSNVVNPGSGSIHAGGDITLVNTNTGATNVWNLGSIISDTGGVSVTADNIGAIGTRDVHAATTFA